MHTFTRLDLADLHFIGSGLSRPECVLCTARGAIYVSDWRGGVTRIEGSDDRRPQFFAGTGDRPLRPNGIALLEDGSFLIAQLGEADGGLYRLDRDGRVTAVLTQLGADPLPPSNFVLVDGPGRYWLTVSTRVRPRSNDYRPTASSGYIVRIDEYGARIVADALGYTNEVAQSSDGRFLYASETFARRIVRYRIGRRGELAQPEIVARFGAGTFPDGICFDAMGGLWVASLVSNRLIRVAPSGDQAILLEDADHAHVQWVEAAYRSGSMGPEHLATTGSTTLRNISSVAFGGPDLRTVHLGCLQGSMVATFRSPIPGVAPYHWAFP